MKTAVKKLKKFVDEHGVGEASKLLGVQRVTLVTILYDNADPKLSTLLKIKAVVDIQLTDWEEST